MRRESTCKSEKQQSVIIEKNAVNPALLWNILEPIFHMKTLVSIDGTAAELVSIDGTAAELVSIDGTAAELVSIDSTAANHIAVTTSRAR